MNAGRKARIAILYPSDPAGSVPSGVDTFIKGILKFAPADIEYTLMGATSDPQRRPVGIGQEVGLGPRPARFVPITWVDAGGRRGRIPLTVRYLLALRRSIRSGLLRDFDAFDCHRIEPLVLLRGDRRPRNVVLHTDMSILRDPDCEIMWRHAPWLYESIEARLFPTADRIYSVRQSAVDRYRARFPSIAERFVFTNTWVDTQVFFPAESTEARDAARAIFRSQAGLNPAAELAVFVGRLDRSKDPVLLLQAFGHLAARRPNLELVLVGDGVLRGELESSIRESGLAGRVHLMGARTSATIAELHRAADVFVLSSLYEGMPIALLEAVASGLPVASTRVGEVARVIREGTNGCIARERSAPALAAAISAALDIAGPLQRKQSAEAIAPFSAEVVLAPIYQNHRRQAGLQA
jgi:glycosyltransferase involved in cell wall biosynthesis